MIDKFAINNANIGKLIFPLNPQITKPFSFIEIKRHSITPTFRDRFIIGKDIVTQKKQAALYRFFFSQKIIIDLPDHYLFKERVDLFLKYNFSDGLHLYVSVIYFCTFRLYLNLSFSKGNLLSFERLSRIKELHHHRSIDHVHNGTPQAIDIYGIPLATRFFCIWTFNTSSSILKYKSYILSPPMPAPMSS